jgi:hypothetical protein
MPALVAGIHALISSCHKKGVDGRGKPSHDGEHFSAALIRPMRLGLRTPPFCATNEAFYAIGEIARWDGLTFTII